jgi:multidrug efflux pump subunit AcrB
MLAPTPETSHKGLIAWFSKNSVAANLLMVFIIVCGVASVLSIRVQIFPEFESQNIRISMSYPGAAPAEIETAIVIPIEQALDGLSGIDRIRSWSNENHGSVSLELLADYDMTKMLDEVQNRLDSISTFPPGAERPYVSESEKLGPVLNVSIRGELDDKALKILAQEIRDQILALPEVSRAMIWGDRPYEIAIEVSENALREYGLTLAQVAMAIRTSSIDMPGGAIRTDSGRIQVRTKEQAYTGEEFGNIVLRSNRDGTRLRVRDIATVTDGFVETEGFSRFDGNRAISVAVVATGEQNVLVIEEAVSAYVAERKLTLPRGVTIDSWQNAAYYLQAQLNMMLSNMALGAVLVFLILAVFLRIKIAAWVMVGIPISFLGALWLMPVGPMPVDINMLSLFGLILVLGIVVDDAIIIGESVYTHVDQHGHSLDSVIEGVHRVAVPATFGVLTTIAAFAPMLLVGGRMASFFEAIAVVVILCLLFSLVESKLILPAHLAHTQFGGEELDAKASWMDKIQNVVAQWLQNLIHLKYKPVLQKALLNRYTTVSLFVGALLLSVGLIVGNFVRVEIFPNIPSDFIAANLTMNDGVSYQQRNQALGQIEKAILSLNEEFPANKPVEHVLVRTEGDTGGFLMVELPKIEHRTMNPGEVERLWRERVGTIVGAKEIRYTSSTNLGGGAKINLGLAGNNYEQLELAAGELAKKMQDYAGVFDVNSSYSEGTEEITLRLKEDARALGLTTNELGAQVQHAFHGYEAQRILRGRDELRVMVRYPKDERSSIHNLENMRIRTANGDEVPFDQVAEVTTGLALSSIYRMDRERTVNVTADVNPEVAQSSQIIEDVTTNFISQLLRKYPDVSFKLGGSSKEQGELAIRILGFFGVAMFLIYTLLAIPLRSYVQPLMVMAVIPFGFIGALIGHIIFDTTFSMMSLFGLVALAGVIVNDSLILVDFVNRGRREGESLHNAVVNAGTSRFRAILLTTLTTFFGLLPMMFESSMQAQLLIPMALSLAFGIVFGTVLTLFMIPCLYLILEDVINLVLKRRPALMVSADQ